MWILFALTSATILASRKIQEKRLVDIFGQSLGWMIRTGSAITVILIWLLLSRDTTGVDNPIVWIVVVIIALIMYPIQTYTYYRAMHAMPLSTFGMLSPVVFFSSAFFAYIFFGTVPNLMGYLGLLGVSIGAILLIPKQKNKKDKKHIPISVFLIAIMSYTLMGLGGVMDKVAMSHTSPFFYAVLNQLFSAIAMIILSKMLYKNLRIDTMIQHRTPIISIALLSGIAWFLGIYSIQISPNVGYATALINMHALFTAIYGVFFLHEDITKEKILAFSCMLLALVAFAFA